MYNKLLYLLCSSILLSDLAQFDTPLWSGMQSTVIMVGSPGKSKPSMRQRNPLVMKLRGTWLSRNTNIVTMSEMCSKAITAQQRARTYFRREVLILSKGWTTLTVRVIVMARLKSLDQLTPGRAVTMQQSKLLYRASCPTRPMLTRILTTDITISPCAFRMSAIAIPMNKPATSLVLSLQQFAKIIMLCPTTTIPSVMLTGDRLKKTPLKMSVSIIMLGLGVVKLERFMVTFLSLYDEN